MKKILIFSVLLSVLAVILGCSEVSEAEVGGETSEVASSEVADPNYIFAEIERGGAVPESDFDIDYYLNDYPLSYNITHIDEEYALKAAETIVKGMGWGSSKLRAYIAEIEDRNIYVVSVCTIIDTEDGLGWYDEEVNFAISKENGAILKAWISE